MPSVFSKLAFVWEELHLINKYITKGPLLLKTHKLVCKDFENTVLFFKAGGQRLEIKTAK